MSITSLLGLKKCTKSEAIPLKHGLWRFLIALFYTSKTKSEIMYNAFTGFFAYFSAR